jgi:hypothetical protein
VSPATWPRNTVWVCDSSFSDNSQSMPVAMVPQSPTVNFSLPDKPLRPAKPLASARLALSVVLTGGFKPLEDVVDDRAEVSVFPRRPFLPGDIDGSEAGSGQHAGRKVIVHVF